MIELPIVKKHLGPLLERHRRSIDILRERADSRGGVVYFDVSDLDLEGYNKFIPYYLYPDALYTVGVSASPTRAEGFGGYESVEGSVHRSESRVALRKIWRRRPRARRRDFARSGRPSARPPSRQGNCGDAAALDRRRPSPTPAWLSFVGGLKRIKSVLRMFCPDLTGQAVLPA